jgi:hypothetical protein
MGTMMECGHSANATTTIKGKTVPCCAICIMAGTEQDKAMRIAGGETYDLSARTAVCSYGSGKGNVHPDGRPVPSSSDLPFFRHLPDQERDQYYCGCFGWD